MFCSKLRVNPGRHAQKSTLLLFFWFSRTKLILKVDRDDRLGL